LEIQQPRPAVYPAARRLGRRNLHNGYVLYDQLLYLQADVGIVIGAGSDVAVETADIILVRSNPLDGVAIVQLSRARYRKLIQNLVWATGYNVVAIPLAAGAMYTWGMVLSPAMGAALMAASTVIMAINARLLRLKK
jgi:Cu2+-exporting ATPase